MTAAASHNIFFYLYRGVAIGVSVGVLAFNRRGSIRVKQNETIDRLSMTARSLQTEWGRGLPSRFCSRYTEFYATAFMKYIVTNTFIL